MGGHAPAEAGDLVVALRNLRLLEAQIRERATMILDDVAVGETFNWAEEHVSIELTTALLAILFEFSYEDRRWLTFWSDMATASEALPNGRGRW